jgi:alpha-beta hydrolase superfamily lysophospholipase
LFDTRSWLEIQDFAHLLDCSVFSLTSGLGEHALRYDEFAKELAKQRIAIFAFDQRGHGRSGGLRGYADHIDEFEVDLQEHFELVTSQLSADMPLFVM